MKKVVILGSKNPGEKNDARAVAEQLLRNNPDLDVTTLFIENLVITIDKDKQTIVDAESGIDLRSVSLLIALNWYRGGKQSIYRDMAYSIALYLENHGVEFWNREMLQQRSATKLSAMMELALQGFDVPHTVYSMDTKQLVSHATKFPVVAKVAGASRGRGNYLCKDVQELQDVLGDVELNPFLLQEYLPNDRDLRIVCFGGKPTLVIERARKNKADYLNNVSQGATAKLLEIDTLSQEIIEICEKICYIMGREMAGIDILPVKDGERYVFLEVNPIPQLTNGAFTEEKMSALANTLKKTLKDKQL